MKEIAIQEIKNIMIGQVEDPIGGTGCTVFVCPQGMPAGSDVRGGGPASRESELMNPLAAAQFIHAVLLGGGSAFGLDAAGGVMQYLEEQGIGLPVGPARVPLVCQADIFDLGVGDYKARPGKDMGYRAAQTALAGGNYRDGNYGAGCGATVGKVCGPTRCMKSGIGSYAVQVGDLQVGAVVVVNAIGDIHDHKTGRKVAGVLTEDKMGFAGAEEEMIARVEAAYVQQNRAGGPNAEDRMEADQAAADRPDPDKIEAATNTTIGIILTNAKFDKPQLCKIAGMTHDGYARSIRPIHTSMDGDTIFAVSLGEVAADRDLVGSLAANVMSEAILRAVENTEGAFGLLSVKDLKNTSADVDNYRGELVDVVDRNGNPTGRFHDRGVEMKEGEYFRAASVMIFNKEGKMLIQKRQSSKKLWPDMWDISACGAFGIGEDPQTAAMREVEEELGLQIDLTESRATVVTTFKTGFTYAFVVNLDVDLSEIRIQNSEVQAVRYATKDEILQMIEEGSFIRYRRSWLEYLFDAAEEGYRF